MIFSAMKEVLMKSKSVLLSLILLAAFLVAPACAPKEEAAGKFEIAYKSYKLDNGLEVILHEDRSDPIAAVAIQFHVGSNREEVGRTGFAHLFEHMMFQESQHVGQDQFFKMIQEAGGTLNGGTSRDGTVYFEVVPNNALELALWLEADRLGYSAQHNHPRGLCQSAGCGQKRKEAGCR